MKKLQIAMIEFLTSLSTCAIAIIQGKTLTCICTAIMPTNISERLMVK